MTSTITFGRLPLGHVLAASLLSCVFASAHADVVYSNIPANLPGNQVSLGYEATSTSEFGDHIALAGNARVLNSITVTMSDWALASTYGSSDPGYQQSLTFNVYNYSGDIVAGALIASKTIDAFVPWRPEADPAHCGAGSTAWYDPSSGNCYNGLAFNVTFDFSGMGVMLPDELVFGLAYNTQHYGSNPTGLAGPVNSLNYAVGGAPTVGTDVNPDGVFWNTAYQGFLTSGTAGVFGQDTGWSGDVPAIQIDASIPEPASLALVGLALAGMAGVSRRRT